MAHAVLMYVFAPAEASAGGPPLLRAAMLCGGATARDAQPPPDPIARAAAAMGLRACGTAASAASAARARSAATLVAPSLLALAAAAAPNALQGAGRYGTATSASAAGTVVAGVLGSACTRDIAIISGLPLLAATARGGCESAAMIRGTAASSAAAAAYAESVLGPAALDSSRIKCGVLPHARSVSIGCVASIAAAQRALDAHAASTAHACFEAGVGCGADVAITDSADATAETDGTSDDDDDAASSVAGVRRLASAYAAAIARDAASLPLAVAMRCVVSPLLDALDESAAESSADVSLTRDAPPSARVLAHSLSSAVCAACPPQWLADVVLPRLLRRVDAGADALSAGLAAAGDAASGEKTASSAICTARAASDAIYVMTEMIGSLPSDVLLDAIVAPRNTGAVKRDGTSPAMSPEVASTTLADSIAQDEDADATTALAGGSACVRLALLASPHALVRVPPSLHGSFAQVDRSAVVACLVHAAGAAGGGSVGRFLLPQLLHVLREPLADEMDDNEGDARTLCRRMARAHLGACASLLKCVEVHSLGGAAASAIGHARLRALAHACRRAGLTEAAETAGRLLAGSAAAAVPSASPRRLSASMSLSPTASLTPGATVPQSPAPSVVDSRRMSLDAALSANGNGALRSAAAAQRDAERWRHAERAVALLAGSGWGRMAKYISRASCIFCATPAYA